MNSDISTLPLFVICKIDMFGMIVSAGSGSCDLLGYEQYELIGKYLRRFVSGGSQETDREMIVQAIRTNGKHQFEFQMRRKDDSIVPVVSSNTWLSNEAKLLCLIYQKQNSGANPEISD